MLILKQYVGLMLLYAIQAYIWLVIVYCIAGFFIRNPYAAWYVFLQELASPPIRFVRRITMNRLVIDRFDLSPIVLLFGLQLLAMVVGHLFR